MERTTKNRVAIDLNNNEVDEESVSAIEDDDDEYLAVRRDFQTKLQTLNPEQMIRGSTPLDIDERCLQLCRSYIGGAWTRATGTEDISVKRIGGGFTNQLYHVRLLNVEQVDDIREPVEVAIKFYQPKHMKNYNEADPERLNDIIILSIASQTGIGPKVYGIFESGFIQAYVKHEQFRKKHQRTPALVRELVHLIAKIHHLKVPISKDSTWQLRIMREFIEFAYEKLDVRQQVQQYNLDAFKQRDLLEEFADFERMIANCHSPLVFSHIDFRGSNILVTESPHQRLLAVDMEHCAYAPRAYDLATILSEWDKELFDFENVGMPSNEVIENFVRLYIEACDRLEPGYASAPQNSVAIVVRETKLFILCNVMFFIALSIKQEEVIIEAVPFNPLIKMTYVNNCYRLYHRLKAQLVQDGTICSE